MKNQTSDRPVSRKPPPLLARVFSADISECAACGGRLRIIAALTDLASTRTCLEGVVCWRCPRRGSRISRCLSTPPDLLRDGPRRR